MCVLCWNLVKDNFIIVKLRQYAYKSMTRYGLLLYIKTFSMKVYLFITIIFFYNVRNFHLIRSLSCHNWINKAASVRKYNFSFNYTRVFIKCLLLTLLRHCCYISFYVEKELRKLWWLFFLFKKIIRKKKEILRKEIIFQTV